MNTWSQDLLPDDKRGKFIGIFNITNTVSQIVGSAVGALLLVVYQTGSTPQAHEMANLFPYVAIFFLLSVPLFLKVEETLPSAKIN